MAIVVISFVFGFYKVLGLTWLAIPWMYPAEVERSSGTIEELALRRRRTESAISWRYYRMRR